MNKNLSYGIISVCILLTSFFVYRSMSRSGNTGLNAIDADSIIWVKCKTSTCQAAQEMGEREFLEAVQANASPGQRRGGPGLLCDQCGKMRLYKAQKCPEAECLAVFFYGSAQNDFPDRCPKCKVSQTEKSRKERRSRSAEE